MRLSLFFDVEDPYNPLSDAAALDVVRAFDNVGIRGCFCVTGEKCRVLVERGRHDVLDALKPHSLGLHTNTHSVHPTTMELLENCEWDDGVEAAIRAEGPGVEKFLRAFDRLPDYWGGAGFTWGPQIAGALSHLGVPSYVYAITEVPGKRIHKFAETIAFPLMAVVPDRVYERRLLVSQLVGFHIARKLRASTSSWAGVLMGHPSRLRYKSYFDEPFAGGSNPEPYPLQTAKSEADYQRVLKNLKKTLELIKSRFEIVGIDEELKRPMPFRDLDAGELAYARQATIYNLRKRAREWPSHKQDLRTDKLEEVTLSRLDSLQTL